MTNDKTPFTRAIDALGNPALVEGGMVKTAATIARDPITNMIEFQLFTDDGFGNGNHIFTLPIDLLVDALRTAAYRVDENCVGNAFLEQIDSTI